MKYMFLDVDGVLNSYFHQVIVSKNTLDRDYMISDDISPYNIEVLKFITREAFPDMNIIISSSWCYNYKLIRELKNIFIINNIPIYDLIYTPSKKEFNKKELIIEYIKNKNIHPNSVVIIDDDQVFNFKDRLNRRFIRTNPHDGLTYNDYLKMCKLFNKKPIIKII